VGVEVEAELVERWSEAAGRNLVDTEGQTLVVQFPGRCWGGPGPDFRGAVLRLASGELVRGDVELHRRASGWTTHGHARDPAFRDVVLHVVGRADRQTFDNNGRRLRTLELRASPAAQDRLALAPPCVRGPPAVDAAIARAGQQRLARKAERFRLALIGASPDQVVWRGVAEALGYARNSVAMTRVADAVPWERAQAVLAEAGAVGLTTLLLGSAGLLPAATLAEAHAWRRFERAGARPALDVWAWRLAAVRSANHPVPRLRGLAALAVQWQAQLAAATRSAESSAPIGLAALMLARLRAAVEAKRPRLWDLFAASPWVGRGRAQVVVVNVLLPVARALGVTGVDALYARLPGEPSNRVSRYMAELLGEPGQRFASAQQQQGLVQLFNTTCASRWCERCDARSR
jgi:hypothetical protein